MPEHMLVKLLAGRDLDANDADAPLVGGFVEDLPGHEAVVDDDDGEFRPAVIQDDGARVQFVEGVGGAAIVELADHGDRPLAGCDVDSGGPRTQGGLRGGRMRQDEAQRGENSADLHHPVVRQRPKICKPE